MTREAQSKKILDTLFGWGVNFCRAKRLSNINPGSGRAPGCWVDGIVDRAYGVFAAPSFGRSGLLLDPSADL